MIEQHEPHENREWTQVLRKGWQFPLYMWHLLCYYCYKLSDKSWMSKGPDCDYEERNYPWSFVTHILRNGQPSHGGEVVTST
jgi:hypothetical protein